MMFHNILMPVHLNKNTGSAINKAIEFSNQLDCHLHLLQVVTPSPFSALFNSFKWLPGIAGKGGKGYKLLELRSRYSKQLKPGLKLYATVLEGNTAKSVAKYAEINEIDMILIGDQPKRFLFLNNKFDITQLTQITNCPVLTVKPQPDLQPFKIIVLPVGGFIPINKIRVAISLAKQFKAAIHLLALEKSGMMQQEELSCMKKTFRVLKENTDIPVVCNTLAGEGLANIAMKYAQQVGAGLIVVNPGAESQLSGFRNHLFSGSVMQESKVPVITVV